MDVAAVAQGMLTLDLGRHARAAADTQLAVPVAEPELEVATAWAPVLPGQARRHDAPSMLRPVPVRPRPGRSGVAAAPTRGALPEWG